ncbi:hypothetical protein [Alloscardovia macacae]|uniref:CTP synthase n=1 Tax=Alloscardovia macacae TaxID=1160091 RepID=A0A261F5R6_9BIFI|nr:hypothetical protein [Alloscardovia macacae]OZG54246.1 hypothetical protein ALMA_0707 [Alloscardovia macacae]
MTIRTYTGPRVLPRLPLNHPKDRNLRRQAVRRCQKGTIVQPLKGYFADAQEWRSLSAAQRIIATLYAISVVHAFWVVSGISAALLYGCFDGGKKLGHLHKNLHFAMDQHTCTRRRKNLHQRHHYIPDSRPYKEIEEAYQQNTLISDSIFPSIARIPFLYKAITATVGILNGLPITSPLQTIFDLMRLLPFDLAVPACNHILRLFRISRADLLAFLETRTRCKRYRYVFANLRFTTGQAENEAESLALVEMIKAGFVMPKMQIEFPNVFYGKRVMRKPWMKDTRTHRVDYAWRIESNDQKTYLIAELDGFEKYSNPNMIEAVGARTERDVFYQQVDRDNSLMQQGCRIQHFSYDDAAYDHAANLIMKLEALGVPRVSDTVMAQRREAIALSFNDPSLLQLD